MEENNKRYPSLSKSLETRRYILIADEFSNLPEGYKDIKDEHFHSSHTCDIEMRAYRYKRLYGSCKTGGGIITKYCHTHNVVCSKTGWEIGFYRGTETNKLASANSHGGLTINKSTGGRVIDLEKDYELVDSKFYPKNIK